MAQGALAASFAVSGTHFQVSSGKLTSSGLASYVHTDRDADVRGHPVALLGIGRASLADICQSARVRTPVGTVVFKLTAGGRAALSFAATNLGGFLVGMALGIAGSAMGFGWTPGRDPAPTGGPAPVRGGGGGKVLAVALPVALLAAVGGPAQRARAAAGIPAPSRPPTVTTTMFAPQGFTLAGVEEVPTARGPVRAMVLRMTAASLTDYRLTTHDGGPELGLSAEALNLRGEVTLYLTRFSGCLEGLVCLTFTPDTLPVPPVVPPFVFMTDVDAEQALVTSDLITADGLRLRAGARSGPGA
ncbi:DUF6230 family protein [Streptomyces lydicus]